MSDTEVTETVWITRPRIAVRHIRGLLQALEGVNALDYAEVKIMVVDKTHVVEFRGRRLTHNNLPAEGVLFVGEREIEP